MLLNMKDLLKVAKENKFAVPAFNISDYSMFLGVMKTCEQLNAPVIIEIHPDELSFIGCDLVKAIQSYAYKTSIPVCIHLDHGASIEQCMMAIQAGFTSVMIDASSQSFKKNIELTKEVVKVAHAVNVSVEAELGTIGTTASQEEFESQSILYTRKEDAISFIGQTNVDTLAIAIGTSHGLYPKGMIPKLRLDILEDIEKSVSIPLVLHGGSGNSDEEISKAVQLGISKINISSDIKNAYFIKMREVLQNEKLREPNEIEPPCIDAMMKVVEQKVLLFNDQDKAKYY